MTKNELIKSLKMIKYVKEYEKETYDKAIKIKSDYCILTADWHIPYFSWFWCDKVLQLGKKHKGKRDLIIGGDFFNLDAFSKWDFNDENDNLPSELASAKYIMQELLKVFDRIFISVGNHDSRILYATKGKLNYTHLFHIILDDKKLIGNRIFISNYPYVMLNEKWRVTHSSQYSVNKEIVAKNLNIKYRQNIVNAHGHFISLAKGVSGDDVVGDIGGIFDRKKIHYVNLRDTSHPVWNSGFWVIRNNMPYVFGDGLTDWDFWDNIQGF